MTDQMDVTDAPAPTTADVFRDVMASVCTPVAVVTAMDGQRPHGTTVSAFASLSMEPPLVLVSLELRSDLLGLLRSGRRCGLNVLGTEHAGAARSFARKGTDKFAGVAWDEQEGVPRLAGVTGWLACEVIDLVPGGDHVIVVGQVLRGDTTPGAPLTYHQRAFGTHTVLDA